MGYGGCYCIFDSNNCIKLFWFANSCHRLDLVWVLPVPVDPASVWPSVCHDWFLLFCRRSYQKQEITSAIDKVRQQNRQGLLLYRPKCDKATVFSRLSTHITLTFQKSETSSTYTGPSSSHQLVWMRSSRNNQSWHTERQKYIDWYGWQLIPVCRTVQTIQQCKTNANLAVDDGQHGMGTAKA